MIKEILPGTGGARIIGLTGSPGVGKSTVTGALVAAYRAQRCRVAVLAVDPSSPFTGGALLGDRVRMQDHATDGQVFIRSMASRGHLGGVAASTPQALRVLDAAGFDPIIIETVGVGQAEVAVASLADSVVVLLAPGMGDAIQAAKAGILEVADLFVVNKADKPDSHQVVRDLRNMLALAQREPGDWKPPIVTTVAMKGEGIDELVSDLDAHWAWLGSGGRLALRRQARAREEIAALAFARCAAGWRPAAWTRWPTGSPTARSTHSRPPTSFLASTRADRRNTVGPWVSRLSCRLIRLTGRRRSGPAGSVPRRRWPRSPRSCARSRSCSASSTHCCGRMA